MAYRNDSYNPMAPIEGLFTHSYLTRKPTEKTIGGKEFKYIGDEEYRTYFYSFENDVVEVTIKNPEWLRVTETGSHRVVDRDGAAYYIPPDFLYIKWNNRPGTERVNF